MKFLWLIVLVVATLAHMTFAFHYTDKACSPEDESCKEPLEHTCAPGHTWDGEKIVLSLDHVVLVLFEAGSTASCPIRRSCAMQLVSSLSDGLQVRWMQGMRA
uniref:Uncharacterized protein n=1 Tax=Anopheles atroparvus TaxID=41427 RepID=A0A182J7P9_ANOAO